MSHPSFTTSKPAIINWKCLVDDDSMKIAPNNLTQSLPRPQISFAQALTNSNICDIPSSQLPKPTLKGDNFSILIPDDEYEKGLDSCKNNLHARIFWPKGSSPLMCVALKEKLKPVWKNLGLWGVSSIGKGFYEFVFSSIEDARRVRSVGSWMLNPGLLKLFPWTSDFNADLQTNTSAQVWLKIYGLSQEYWRKKIFCVDAMTSKPAMERTFGLFARVLVDIDLTKELKYEGLVERKGYTFFVDFAYKNLPDFCDYCKIVGHSVHNCRKQSIRDAGKDVQKNTNDGISRKNEERKGKEPS